MRAGGTSNKARAGSDNAIRKKKARPGNRNRRPSAWQKSKTFAAIGAQTLDWFRAHRHEYPKCGARAKSTGEPCKQIALANGKCRWHGGATPSGSGWGKRQLRPKPPSKQRPGDWRKVEAKLIERKRADEDRVRRLRAMTDDQFHRYIARMGRRLNDPYSPIFNKGVRDELARRGQAPSKMLTEVSRSRSTNPEITALAVRIDALRNQLAEMTAATQPIEKIEGVGVEPTPLTGVFE